MKRKLPEKFFEQNQRAKTRKWKFFNLNQALWGAGNREFRVNADVRKTDHFRVAAVTVNCCGKEIGHFRSRAPVVVVWMPGRSFRNVVAVEDHDGKVRELQGSIHRHFFGFHVPEKAGVRAHFLPISAFDGIFMLPRKTDLSFGLSWIKTEFCLL